MAQPRSSLFRAASLLLWASYNFPIEVPEGANGTVDFDLWNTNKCRVSGQGTLTWNVHYVREYIEGNWDSFTGRLIVKGTGNAGSSQFAIRNGTGIKNGVLTLKGNAAVHGAKTNVTYYLGGLSGDGSTVSRNKVQATGDSRAATVMAAPPWSARVDSLSTAVTRAQVPSPCAQEPSSQAEAPSLALSPFRVEPSSRWATPWPPIRDSPSRVA